jgi:CBS domain-containing protein
MEPMLSPSPTQHVFRGHGKHIVRVPICGGEDPGHVPAPTIADQIPVRQIMSSEVICACEDLDVAALIDLMMRHRIGCIPVIDERGRPIGMVTKLDLVEHLVAMRAGHEHQPAIAGELMLPLAIVLDEHATVAQAAALMAVEDVHHIAVVANSGALIGVISTLDIVRWLAANDGITSAVPRLRSL